MNQLILLIILINLIILNIITLDFINNFNIVNLALYNIHLTINKIKIHYNFNNQNITKENYHCKLDCDDVLDTIINFYNTISQFKNTYEMIPIKNYNFDNYKCRILYYKMPKNDIEQIIKEDRYFTFDYYITINYNYNYKCNWYITDMSAKL